MKGKVFLVVLALALSVTGCITFAKPTPTVTAEQIGKDVVEVVYTAPKSTVTLAQLTALKPPLEIIYADLKTESTGELLNAVEVLLETRIPAAFPAADRPLAQVLINSICEQLIIEAPSDADRKNMVTAAALVGGLIDGIGYCEDHPLPRDIGTAVKP